MQNEPIEHKRVAVLVLAEAGAAVTRHQQCTVHTMHSAHKMHNVERGRSYAALRISDASYSGNIMIAG